MKNLNISTNYQLRHKWTMLLYFLLGIDLAFILADYFYSLGFLPNEKYAIDLDFGYGEIYQYLKALAIALIFASLFYLGNQLVYLVWSALFVCIFLDDSLRLHEQWGIALQPYLPRSLELAGELLIFSVFGLLFCWLFTRTYRQLGSSDRSLGCQLFILLAILFFFGAVLDFIHSLLSLVNNNFVMAILEQTLVSVENGGEMVVFSIFLALLFKVLQQKL